MHKQKVIAYRPHNVEFIIDRKPSIYVVATGKSTGKTTTALGLASHYHKRYGSIGFMKPVGQSSVIVEGVEVDKDAPLFYPLSFQSLQGAYSKRELEYSSPIVLNSGKTKSYLENPTSQHEKNVSKLNSAFDYWNRHRDFVLFEGSGHVGVGSVIGLSNARIAEMFHAPVVLVSPGGIGDPLDKIALSQALLQQHGVDILGVIMNKVLPEKLAQTIDFGVRGLRELNLKLLGCVPNEGDLAKPTFFDLEKAIKDITFISNQPNNSRIKSIQIPLNLSELDDLQDGTLVIVPSNDYRLYETLFSAEKINKLVGVAFVHNQAPPQNVINELIKFEIPAFITPLDAVTLLLKLNAMEIKTRPGDHQKIETAQARLEAHVNFHELDEAIRNYPHH